MSIASRSSPLSAPASHRRPGLFFLVSCLLAGSVWGCTTTASMRPYRIESDEGKTRIYAFPTPVVFDAAKMAVGEAGLTTQEEGANGGYLIASQGMTLGCSGLRVGLYLRKDGASTLLTVVNKPVAVTSVFCHDFTEEIHVKTTLNLLKWGGGRQPALSTTVPELRRTVPVPATTYGTDYARRVGVVIGIDDYEDWPSSTLARSNARRVAAALREQGFDEIIELYDRDATRARLLQLLGEDLAQETTAEDLLVIFFSGHGYTETLSNGSKRGYLIPADAKRERVFSSAVSVDKLRDLSHRLPAKHVYYVMDSSLSGLGFIRGARNTTRTRDYQHKMKTLRAVQMITAGTEDEASLRAGDHGVFTTVFLEALRGEADFDHDGVVTASEIGAYVRPRVTQLSHQRQTPRYGTLEGGGEIMFAIE